MIYFAQMGPKGPVKIGHTRDADALSKRMRTLDAGLPYPLKLLSAGPGGPSVERALHALFAEHRIRREWFRPVPVVLAAAADLASVDVRFDPAAHARADARALAAADQRCRALGL